MKNSTRIVFAALALAAATLGACNNNKTDSTTATAAKMEANATPVNKMCAMNPKEEANAKVTSTCDGKTVAFCCVNCKGKFDKMSHEQQEAVVAKAK